MYNYTNNQRREDERPFEAVASRNTWNRIRDGIHLVYSIFSSSIQATCYNIHVGRTVDIVISFQSYDTDCFFASIMSKSF